MVVVFFSYIENIFLFLLISIRRSHFGPISQFILSTLRIHYWKRQRCKLYFVSFLGTFSGACIFFASDCTFQARSNTRFSHWFFDGFAMKMKNFEKFQPKKKRAESSILSGAIFSQRMEEWLQNLPLPTLFDPNFQLKAKNPNSVGFSNYLFFTGGFWTLQATNHFAGKFCLPFHV